MRLVVKSLILLLSLASNVAVAKWDGYINNKMFASQRYGYMAISGGGSASAIRFVCFPPVGFRLYIDPRLMAAQANQNITFKVDSLPAHRVPLQQSSGDLIVSESYQAFWDLVAQMIAGNNVQIGTSGNTHRFSLDGFTGTYERVCGWMDGSKAYENHIDDYQ